MDETLRIILIIIISVSIFGLILFVWVKNYMKKKIEYFLEEKNKKKFTKD
tara:strand:- start:302 stop:451 length:150 start_codon:yes stop_codon:yes gene_type:complete